MRQEDDCFDAASEDPRYYKRFPLANSILKVLSKQGCPTYVAIEVRMKAKGMPIFAKEYWLVLQFSSELVAAAVHKPSVLVSVKFEY